MWTILCERTSKNVSGDETFEGFGPLDILGRFISGPYGDQGAHNEYYKGLHVWLYLGRNRTRYETSRIQALFRLNWFLPLLAVICPTDIGSGRPFTVGNSRVEVAEAPCSQAKPCQQPGKYGSNNNPLFYCKIHHAIIHTVMERYNWCMKVSTFLHISYCGKHFIFNARYNCTS